MDKRTVLQQITFGKRIAEEEQNELESYFVETDQWSKMFTGEVDIVYGSKGAGKSAIYYLLLQRQNLLEKRGVLLAAAENPRGEPVFADLVADPPVTENEFRSLLKMYFLTIMGRTLRERGIEAGISQESIDKVVIPLEDAEVLPREKNVGLKTLLKSAIDSVRKLLQIESYEAGIELHPVTGQATGVIGKIRLKEPNTSQRNSGIVSIDQLFIHANSAFAETNKQFWLVLDRLDVAFAESEELEGNALRALFRVYLDLFAYDNVSLKIFLRSDIWKKITEGGFREASHITRYITIEWNNDSLLNLIVRRMLKN